MEVDRDQTAGVACKQEASEWDVVVTQRRWIGVLLFAVGVPLVAVGLGRVASEDDDVPTTEAASPTTTPQPTTSSAPSTTASPPTTAPASTTVTQAPSSPSTTSSPTTTTPITTTTTTSTTTTTTSTTTTSTTTTTTAPPETPEEFLALLVAGLRGDAEFLVSRLNQATFDIYGEEQCRTNLPALLDPESDLTLREIGEPESWDYTVDGVVTRIEDALPVEVERIAAGQTLIQEIHWKLVDGLWTWFTDCGAPLAG